MNIIISICFFLVNWVLNGSELPTKTYQDIFINGSIITQGHGPNCATRYEAIKKVLDLYKRPITMLDIGASEGYFSFRAAYDYNLCAVMIGDPLDRNNILQKLCVKNKKLKGIILLSKRVTAKELINLAETDHFDLVLALNVIHHFDKDWQEAYTAILKLGDNVIIETPPNGDLGACGGGFLAPINARIDSEDFILLGQFKRHTDPTKLDRLILLSNPNVDYVTGKRFRGLHYRSFQALNGRYPRKAALKKALGKYIFK